MMGHRPWAPAPKGELVDPKVFPEFLLKLLVMWCNEKLQLLCLLES